MSCMRQGFVDVICQASTSVTACVFRANTSIDRLPLATKKLPREVLEVQTHDQQRISLLLHHQIHDASQHQRRGLALQEAPHDLAHVAVDVEVGHLLQQVQHQPRETVLLLTARSLPHVVLLLRHDTLHALHAPAHRLAALP